MDIFVAIVFLIAFGFFCYKANRGLFSVVGDFWELCDELFELLTDFLETLCTPFIAIYEAVGAKIKIKNPLKKDNFLTRFIDNHPTLGTPKSIIFVISSIVFLCVMAIFFAPHKNPGFIDEAAQTLPFFYVLHGIGGGFEFSLDSFLGIGISVILVSILPKIFMDDYEIDSFGSFVVSVVHYVTTTLVAALLAYLLKGVVAKILSTVVWLFNIFKTNVFSPEANVSSWIIAILSVIPLIIIAYLLLIVLITAIRDFIDMLCYAVVGFGIFIAVGLAWSAASYLVGGWESIVSKVVIIIVAIISIFGADYFRVNRENIDF